MKNLVLIILIFSMFVGNIYTQDVPRVISYQGVLVGADGKPESGNKRLTFTIINDNSQPHSSGFNHTQEFLLQGGLFFAELGNLQYSNIPFPTLEGQWYLQITDGVNPPYPKIPLYSTVSALNIADNVVISQKIKDGEVKSIDIGDYEVVKSIKGLKEAIEIVAGNPNIRIRVDGQNIVIEGKDTVKAAEQLIGGIPTSVPVGTIVAFYGLTSQVHPDWLLCNGDNVNQSSYPDLFNHLNTLYGSSKLPDLRGMFLRGADLGIGNDPDTAISTSNGRRWPIGIGANTERIGSMQLDAFQGHAISLRWNGTAGINYNGFRADVADNISDSPGGLTKIVNDGVNGEPRTSSETRPKNVYVNYIIKAR